MEELPKDISARLDDLAEEGNALSAAGKWAEAFDAFMAMWQLLPMPKEKWNASTWILAALGDVCFAGGQYESARTNLEAATACPGGVGNAFVHLRLGQTYYELGLQSLVADELMRAYALGGRELFSKEDKKYIEFLESRAKL